MEMWSSRSKGIEGWCFARRLRRALLGCAILAAGNLAVSGGYAQDRDESWVISHIVAGKFDELRSLEKLSGQGVPFALYWWGLILGHCIFERCDGNAGQELLLRAALSGNGRAKAELLADAQTREEFDEVIAKIGVPSGGWERLNYITKSLFLLQAAFVRGGRRPTDDKLQADLLAIAKSEPHIGVRIFVAILPGQTSSDLDVLAATGTDLISEKLMVHATVKKIGKQQIIERARAGELGWAAAYCDNLILMGRTLDRDELEVCEKAAGSGFLAAVRGLLAHHQFTGNTRAAQYFADLCETVLGMRCADLLADYYHDRSKESSELKAKSEFWELAAVNAIARRDPGRFSEEPLRGKTPRLRRELFQLIVRTALTNEACAMQRVDLTTGAIEANPQCPWRKPIAIPAEFLTTAK